MSMYKHDGPVYINTVGTLGISSASYYWNRISGAIGRLTQHLAGHSSATWQMLVAERFSSGSRRIGLFVCTCRVLHPVCGCRGPFVVVEDSWRGHGGMGWI